MDFLGLALASRSHKLLVEDVWGSEADPSSCFPTIYTMGDSDYLFLIYTHWPNDSLSYNGGIIWESHSVVLLFPIFRTISLKMSQDTTSKAVSSPSAMRALPVLLFLEGQQPWSGLGNKMVQFLHKGECSLITCLSSIRTYSSSTSSICDLIG